MHVGTFSPEGTFDGAIEHLGHLVDLGVTVVEVMPVAEGSGTTGMGVRRRRPVGAPPLLRRARRASSGSSTPATAAGLGVVLDVVYNHLGPAGNYLSEFGPYFTDRYRTPWGWAVNLDGEGSYGIRDFVISNALMWFTDYHVDGLRLDAVHAIFDEGALHILEELSAAVERLAVDLGRDLWLIAESDRNDPRDLPVEGAARVRHRRLLGRRFPPCPAHRAHRRDDGYYRDFGRISQLAKVFRDGYVFDGQFSEFRQRRHGRPAGRPARRVVRMLPAKPRPGRQPGLRRAHIRSGRRRTCLKVGAALVLLSPFVPMLFQGEEWGASTPFLYFTDHQDPELGQAVREGRRREYPVSGRYRGARPPGP